MKIGIVKEEKIPADKRTPLTPIQCRVIMDSYSGIEILVESSDIRCFKDEEYLGEGIQVVNDLSSCNMLMGIKEVPTEKLIPNKTYLFFSHTIKKQDYNRGLLQKMIDFNIRMIDYEALKDSNGKRLLGFGRYAGIVGAYNSFLTYGLKSKKYTLKPAHSCFNRLEMESELKKLSLDNERILLTGSGRVGGGVIEILNKANIKQVGKNEFLKEKFNQPIFTQLNTLDYNIRKDMSKSNKNEFYKYPDLYKSCFIRYAMNTDIYIAGHYHSANSPSIFTKEDAKNCAIKVIGDISCDINGPIASTIRSSNISEPIYGYNPKSEQEDNFLEDGVIAVMAVDNLPCELPINSSEDFGESLINNIFPILLKKDNQIINKATICANGRLTSYFEYLSDYISRN